MASPQPGPLRFLDLPIEIKKTIIEYTPYHSLLALRSTMNRQVVSLITHSDVRAARTLHRDYLSQGEDPSGPFLSLSRALSELAIGSPAPSSLWLYPTPKAHLHKHSLPPASTPRHNPTVEAPYSRDGSAELFACSICFLCLPRWHFSARQASQATVGGSRRRFCIDCAIATRTWVPGSTTVDGCFICKGCTGFKMIGSHGLRVGLGSGVQAGTGGEMQQSQNPRLTAMRGEWWCFNCLGTILSDAGAEGTEAGSADGVMGTETSTRRDRCQRCWAIDHTEEKAEKEVDGRPLCEGCWLLMR